ncbi:hypothetical protein Ddye_019935 [Dipteronia dyeriana]|uniref:Ubiquitin-like protease family profile domain-containing protein n=1 Tax=Dipteronia dyeriana TaxID=168575 RepID=A0AAD9TZU3_9ROSI|nr:hypothetical protein Ddye_019935 [Dipteronia dyeriana]
MASCFKQFGQFPTNWLFSAQIVHSLLLREIQIDGASENELWFSVGGKKARFGQREFCLVTGLRFGKIYEIVNTPYVANENGIHKRYLPDEEAEDLKLSTVYDRFIASNFLKADDLLKIALFLIANNVLFGQPFDKKVTPWLFNLFDDLEAFNGFAWGHYVFKMMLHYLSHGFRSRNSKKGYGKVRYRLYGFPWAVEADVKEVLEATDDEAQADYWVGVDYNMTEGPQFIPLVEMEMKENHELLDEGDDGNDGVVGDGDNDDGAATSQRALKRKAQKMKKKTSVKKKQRKAVPVTRLDQDEDYTPGYTPTPYVDYTPGYTPTPLPPHPHMSSRQEPRSKGDARITELLEAVRALPDVLDVVVKREVAHLPCVLRSLVQEIQSSRGESNHEAPMTVVRDPSLDREEVHTIVIDQEVVDPATEKVDPAMEKKLQQDKSKYDQFKKKAKAARQNVGMEESVDKSFFMELEDPTKWLSTDHVDAYVSYLVKRRESDPDNYRHSLVLLSTEFYTKLNLAWKKILETDNEVESSFDALAFQCPHDWIEYGFGNRSGWGQPWWLYTQLSVPCCVGEPNGHWILCKVDLLDHHITIFDPTGAKKKSIQVERFRKLMPLRRLLPMYTGGLWKVGVFVYNWDGQQRVKMVDGHQMEFADTLFSLAVVCNEC